MAYIRKRPISPWDALSWEQHEEAQLFVKSHPDGGNLNEIGRLMGITGERVRQIHERALAKLRAYLGVQVDEAREYERLPRVDELEDLELELEDVESHDEDESWAA
jgi:hypothetical protein